MGRRYDGPCAVQDCPDQPVAQKLCMRHYQRKRRNGILVTKSMDPARAQTRFWKYVDQRGPDECWPWTGTLVRGYGVLFYLGKVRGAHRIAYELAHGELPLLHIDHLCHNSDPTCPGKLACRHRRCVNPRHLEQVTQGTNNARGRNQQTRYREWLIQ